MRILSILSGVLLSGTLAAQTLLTPAMKEVYDDIYKLKVDRAESRIDSLQRSGAAQWSLIYLRLTHMYIQHMVNEDPGAYEEDRDQLESWAEYLKDNDQSTTEEYYMIMGDVYLQMASVEAKYNNRWSSAQYALSGLNILEDGLDDYPDHKPFYIGSGLLNVAIGSMPDSYKWVAALMGYSGDVQSGLKQLDDALRVTRNAEYAHLRDKFIFVNAYVKHQLDSEGASSLRSYGVDPSKNPLHAYLEAKILDSKGKNDDLISLLENVQRLPGRYPFPHLDYFLGRAKVARGDRNAQQPLLRYLEANKGKHFKKSTLRYLNWHYRIHGNQRLAEEYRQRAIREGDDYVGADLQAMREMEAPPIPIDLLLARLRFDAGAYQQALDILTAELYQKLVTEEHLLEYHYRRGRCYQELVNRASAIRHFKACIQYTVFPTTYSRVNAELQLGILLEDTDPSEAEKHYRHVLGFSDYPWYEGCQQKAKAGLDRLDG